MNTKNLFKTITILLVSLIPMLHQPNVSAHPPKRNSVTGSRKNRQKHFRRNPKYAPIHKKRPETPQDADLSKTEQQPTTEDTPATDAIQKTTFADGYSADDSEEDDALTLEIMEQPKIRIPTTVGTPSGVYPKTFAVPDWALSTTKIIDVSYVDSSPCSALFVSVNCSINSANVDIITDLALREIQNWQEKLAANDKNLFLLCIPAKLHKEFVEKTIQTTGSLPWNTFDPEFMIDHLPPTQRHLLKVGYTTDQYLLLYHQNYLLSCSSTASEMVYLSESFLRYISDNIYLCLPLDKQRLTSDILTELRPILTDDVISEGVNQMTQLLLEVDLENWRVKISNDIKCRQAFDKLSATPEYNVCNRLTCVICQKIIKAMNDNHYSNMHKEVNLLNVLKLILVFTSF